MSLKRLFIFSAVLFGVAGGANAKWEGSGQQAKELAPYVAKCWCSRKSGKWTNAQWGFTNAIKGKTPMEACMIRQTPFMEGIHNLQDYTPKEVINTLQINDPMGIAACNDMLSYMESQGYAT